MDGEEEVTEQVFLSIFHFLNFCVYNTDEWKISSQIPVTHSGIPLVLWATKEKIYPLIHGALWISRIILISEMLKCRETVCACLLTKATHR